MKKYICALFSHVIRPFNPLAIIVLGLMASFLSGAIEFLVIKDIMVSVQGIEWSNSIYIPLTVVIILEGLKISLHYYLSAIRNKKESISAFFYYFLHGFKVVLIMFSFICSMMYVSNSTMTFNTEKMDAEIESKIRDSEDTLYLNIERINQNVDNEVARSTKDYQATYELAVADRQYQELNKIDTPRNQYLRWEKRLKELQEIENAANERLILEKSKSRDWYQQQANVKIGELKSQHETYANNIYDDPKFIQYNDNPYLRGFLMFFSENLFGKDSYSRQMYFVWVIVISIVISSGLEVSIAFSQSLSSMNSEQIEDIYIPEQEIDKSVEKSMKLIFGSLVSAFLGACVYVMCNITCALSLSKEQMLIAFGSFALAFILVRASGKTFETEVGFIAKYDFLKPLRPLKPVVLKSVIALAFYLAISLFTGTPINEISVTAFGITLGSVGGNLLS